MQQHLRPTVQSEEQKAMSYHPFHAIADAEHPKRSHQSIPVSTIIPKPRKRYVKEHCKAAKSSSNSHINQAATPDRRAKYAPLVHNSGFTEPTQAQASTAVY